MRLAAIDYLLPMPVPIQQLADPEAVSFAQTKTGIAPQTPKVPASTRLEALRLRIIARSF